MCKHFVKRVSKSSFVYGYSDCSDPCMMFQRRNKATLNKRLQERVNGDLADVEERTNSCVSEFRTVVVSRSALRS